MSLLFASNAQNIGASALASVLPMNVQGWFPLGLTGLICLKSKGLSRVFSSTMIQKQQFFGAQPSLWSNSYIHAWLLEKTIALTIQTFVGKVMSLLSNMLFRFVIVPSQEASVFNFMAAVNINSDFGTQENKDGHCFYFFPFYLSWSDGTRCHDLSFLNVEF